MTDPYSVMFCFGSIFGAAIILIVACIIAAIRVNKKIHDVPKETFDRYLERLR